MRLLILTSMFGFSLFSCQSTQFYVKPLFDAVQPFHKGIAAAQQGPDWGFIDTSGNWVILPAFAQASLTANGYQVADHASQLLDIKQTPETGQWQALPAHGDDISVETTLGVRTIFSHEGLFGLKNEQGQMVAAATFEAIHFIENDLFIGKTRYKGEQLLDANGKALTGYVQEVTPALQYGRIRFRQDDRYGLFAPDGRVILPPSMWRLDIAGRNIACTEGGKLKLCTDKLEPVAEQSFDKVIYLDATHWLAKITDTGQGTIFDISGKVVKENIQISDGQMMFGRLPAKNEAGKWGYMDSKGAEVLPFEYEYTESFWPNGKAVVWQPDQQGGNKKGLIDTAGQVVLPAVFSDIIWHPDGVFTVVQDGKFQLLDEQFQPLTPRQNQPAEYAGGGVYILYGHTHQLNVSKSNWYTGEKGGISIDRRAKITGIYSLDGILLVDGKQFDPDEPLPVVSEGLAPAKKGRKWGFAKCKQHRMPSHGR